MTLANKAKFPIGLTLIAASLFTTLCTLGFWQVERLAWKRDLIVRVAVSYTHLTLPTICSV